MASILIAPSLLAADFANLGRDVKMLASSGADIIHLDIMDGSFVPNISFGFPVIESIVPLSEGKSLDAHLMVLHPERWFERLAELGVQMVSFHQEASRTATLSNIEALHSLGLKAGVAINPDIPVRRLYPYIGHADYFLIMSVFAGFGGQKFIYDSLDRIATLRSRIDKTPGISKESASSQPQTGGNCAASLSPCNPLIEVDGGIGAGNIRALAEAGAGIAVAGSSVFGAEDPALAIEALKAI